MDRANLLVVVADDAGVDAARNAGILDAWEHGLLRAASVLANGNAFEPFLFPFRNRAPSRERLEIGLHLNLTEGHALSGPLEGLTHDDGVFLHDKRELWRRALAGHVDPDLVRREALAQLERLAEAGLEPVHANGHQHVHLLPGVRDGLAAALDEFPSVRWVRAAPAVPVSDAPQAGSEWPWLPSERIPPDLAELDDAGWRAQAAFLTLSLESDAVLGGGRRAADVFVGLDLLGYYDADDFLERMAEVREQFGPGAIVETMTHPGECDPENVPFSRCAERELEREVLCSPVVADELARMGFRVGGFRDAPPEVLSG